MAAARFSLGSVFGGSAAGGEAENSKLQSPTFKETSNRKPQCAILELVASSFPGAWSLEFEAFCIRFHSENPKLQSPSFAETSNPKPQCTILALVASSFPGAWSLEF